jgi:hypothetical protein
MHSIDWQSVGTAVIRIAPGSMGCVSFGLAEYGERVVTNAKRGEGFATLRLASRGRGRCKVLRGLALYCSGQSVVLRGAERNPEGRATLGRMDDGRWTMDDGRVSQEGRRVQSFGSYSRALARHGMEMQRGGGAG